MHELTSNFWHEKLGRKEGKEGGGKKMESKGPESGLFGVFCLLSKFSLQDTRTGSHCFSKLFLVLADAARLMLTQELECLQRHVTVFPELP